MPKPKYKISNYLLKNLKFKLESKLGYQLLSKFDCKKMNQLIALETNKSVSESTIYRLFLLSSNVNIPYVHTLDIFAEYLGFSNWFSLENELKNLTDFQSLYGAFHDEKSYVSLLTLSIHVGNLKPIYSFLEQFPQDLSFNKKILIGGQLYHSLRSNSGSNLEFFKQFHSLPIVRETFFELWADPDFQIKNYEEGLLYYLENVKSIDSIKNIQDTLFGNALLLRFYFITSNKAKVLEIGKKIYIDRDFSDKNLEELYIFPKIRYYSYRLLFHYVLRGFDSTYWEWLYDYSKKISKSLNSIIEQRIVIHTLLDTLQINLELQELVFRELSLLFPLVFQFIPPHSSHLPINEKLKYLEVNASKRTQLYFD